MKHRRWDARAKAMVVLEGLKGKPVADICLEYQIGQTQYYRWRDQFLGNIERVFAGSDCREAIVRENLRLRKVIGDLTVELKKSEEVWPR